ncbi:MAG: DUF5615 family PIN-like protein [Phormidesmis sp.]
MKVLIDMNLSPSWTDFFASNGIHATHWVTVGSPNDSDTVLMAWARANGYIVFTHDLDFGALLASTQANAPSVLQLRTQDTFYQAVGGVVLSALRQFSAELEKGALVSVDVSRSRVRILPF